MQSHFQKAVGNPGSVYANPNAVLLDKSLSEDQKKEILKTWQAEAIHLQESVAEGFIGGERSHLDDINQALETLEKRD